VIGRRPTQYVLELDICAYFDSIVRKQLMEMVERRVSDASILRLIGKWIQCWRGGRRTAAGERDGDGSGADHQPTAGQPLPAPRAGSVVAEEVKPRLKGQAYEIRYADDALLCFQLPRNAQRVLEVLPKRFAKYGLTPLHPERRRLLNLGAVPMIRRTAEDQDPTSISWGDAPGCHQPERKFTVHCGPR